MFGENKESKWWFPSYPRIKCRASKLASHCSVVMCWGWRPGDHISVSRQLVKVAGCDWLWLVLLSPCVISPLSRDEKGDGSWQVLTCFSAHDHHKQSNIHIQLLLSLNLPPREKYVFSSLNLQGSWSALLSQGSPVVYSFIQFNMRPGKTWDSGVPVWTLDKARPETLVSQSGH